MFKFDKEFTITEPSSLIREVRLGGGVRESDLFSRTFNPLPFEEFRFIQLLFWLLEGLLVSITAEGAITIVFVKGFNNDTRERLESRWAAGSRCLTILTRPFRKQIAYL